MENSKSNNNYVLVLFVFLAFLTASYIAYSYRTQRDYYRRILDKNSIEYTVPSSLGIAPNNN